MAQDTGTVDAKEPSNVEQVNIDTPKKAEPAKKPTVEQEAEFVGASGNKGAPDAKKKPVVEELAFKANPTVLTDEEEEAKKKKGQEANNGLAQQQPPVSDTKKTEPETEQKFDQGDFVPRISRADMETLNSIWGVPYITPALDESLQNAKIKKGEQNKTTFELANGHKIEWMAEYHGIQGFIGVPGKAKLDDLDAKMIIATLATQGNTEVTLYGARESKEKMWLEAMRQGLTVSNFQPLPSDDPNSVYQKWLRESKDLITGASGNDAPEREIKAQPDPEKPAEEAKAEEKKPEEVKAEETKPEEKKPEEPKAAEAKQEEKKPEEPKAEEAKPEEVKAEAKTADKPSITESSFAKKPAEDAQKPKEAAKVENPAADKPAEEKPVVKDAKQSSFIGDKKEDAPKPTPPAAPKSETLEETLDRRIKQAKNPEVEAALKTLRAEYKSGKLALDDIDKEIVQKRLGGNGALSVSKVNQAINHVATKPENKGIILPTVTEQKPQVQKPRAQQPGSKGP